MRNNRVMSLFLAIGAFCAAAISPTAADDYYKGKTIITHVGYTPGGTNDLVTRAVGQFIVRYMGGNPSNITRNMPGAVTRTLASYLYTIAPKDGTEFGNLDRQITTAALFDPAIKEPFEIRKFNWLGSPFQETLTCVTWHASPVQNLNDLQTKEFLVASPGGNSGESLTEQLMNKLMGTRIKAIHGYPGANEMYLAMQRGEVHGRCGLGWESAKSCCTEWLKNGQMKVLIQLSMNKNPELANVPSLADMPMVEEDRQAIGLIYASQQLGRPFAAPPGMPDDKRLGLRKAFTDTMKDADFIEHMKKLNFTLNPLTGDEIDNVLTSVYNAPKSVIDRAIALGKPQ